MIGIVQEHWALTRCFDSWVCVKSNLKSNLLDTSIQSMTGEVGHVEERT